jgi:hypothetical protein
MGYSLDLGALSLLLLEALLLSLELLVEEEVEALSPELDDEEEALSDLDEPPSLFSDFGGRGVPEEDLWSVAYQPEPLKTMPAGVSTLRRLFLLHSGHRLRGSSVKDWWRSNCTPQDSQR